MSEAAVNAFLEDFHQAPPEHAWLGAERQRAMESFRKAGFPTLHHEAWKYTDVRPLTRRRFRPARPATHWTSGGHLKPWRLTKTPCLEYVFSNGHLVETPASTDPAPGVLVESIAAAAARHPGDLADLLGSQADPDKRAFVALNTAFMSDGLFIRVPDGCDVSPAIHLLFHSGATDESLAAYPRNLIVLGANSRATVIQTYAGGAAEYFTDAFTEIVLGPGAVLDHYLLVEEGAAAFHVGGIAATLDRDSVLDSHAVNLGGLLVRTDIDIRLAAAGARVSLNGLYVTGGRQHVDNHTRIDHLVPHTTSFEKYRGVLDGKSRAVFNGKVVVHKGAVKTDAHQSNANLLLSSGAEVDTKPELEIYADDVKCSHGATVGQIDRNMLFYLRSRAIPEASALSLLTYAFAEDVISRMKCRELRERLAYSVAGRLPDAALLGEFLE